MTGGYVVAMMIGSTLASAVAVPAAVALGGWSLPLAVWAVPAVLALAVWSPLADRASGGTRHADRSALPWGDGFARLAACYLAGSSLMVHGWLTWLPAYYECLGWSPQSAGALLAVWSIAHVPSALTIPALAERRRRWRFWSGLTLGSITTGTLGALVAPDPPLIGPWLWVTLIGLGSGAGFALGLTMIAWRTPDGAASAATSSLALGIGYTVAGLGPLLMGLLIDASGFPAAIGVLLVAAGGVATAIVKIGDLPATALTATARPPCDPFTGGPDSHLVTDPAPARRPQAVLLDVFETCLQLEGLRPRFTALGRPDHELELFFARLLHQGMAMTLAGEAPPFASVAADMLRRTSGRDLSDDQVASVLDGFRELPVHPDVGAAFARLAEAGVPAYGFTHGSAEVAAAALDAGGVKNLLVDVFSCAELAMFKPPPRVYHWACERVGTAPGRTALVAVHSWDVHGAVAAGLLGGYCERLEGRVPDAVARPHVVAPALDDVVEGLLALPE